MSFGIESEARGRFPLFILIRIVKPALGELRKLFELQTDYRDTFIACLRSRRSEYHHCVG